MPLWIGDYLKDTSRLTLSQHGTYLRLLMDQWVNGPTPDDDTSICRILGCTAAEWRKNRPEISRFFEVSGGRWTHGRLEHERAEAQRRSDKAQAKARQGAEARWRGRKTGRRDAPSNAPSIADPMPQAMLEHMPMQCPSPSPLSVPPERATPDQRAWQEAVGVLTANGRMTEVQARSFFGKLISTHRLQPHQLLSSLATAFVNGTPDPTAYLTAAARAVAGRSGPRPAPTVADWSDDVWRSAVAAYEGDPARWDVAVMGPKPGVAGCLVPEAVLAGFVRAAAA